jgi:hypothetical protein
MRSLIHFVSVVGIGFLLSAAADAGPPTLQEDPASARRGDSSDILPEDNRAERIARSHAKFLNELSDRRRLNTFFPNEQDGPLWPADSIRQLIARKSDIRPTGPGHGRPHSRGLRPH